MKARPALGDTPVSSGPPNHEQRPEKRTGAICPSAQTSVRIFGSYITTAASRVVAARSLRLRTQQLVEASGEVAAVGDDYARGPPTISRTLGALASSRACSRRLAALERQGCDRAGNSIRPERRCPRGVRRQRRHVFARWTDRGGQAHHSTFFLG